MFSLFGSKTTPPPVPDTPAEQEQAHAAPVTPSETPLPIVDSGAPPTPLKESPEERLKRTYKQEIELQNALYPKPEDVPSCMDLFDARMKCMIGGTNQGRHIYQYGALDGCRDQENDFWFCWSNLRASSDAEQKRELWVNRRAEWWTSRRLGASSEDVWDARPERLTDFPPMLKEGDEQVIVDMANPSTEYN
ncbi:Protein of unknown function DUF3128 [Phaffia rhodozyma]|uniref:Early meiotic induction protein 1 n=1 Tax=Phaffia rhodozyma TaxID=264483 RepID=A0A0F7SKY5_PHARH|nr:Protein of unknown function DUF3128 [Phaffia rhodozyma]